METVGEATWSHSLKALEPGGTLVVSGATSGSNPPADLSRVFFRQLSVVGSTMGTRAELETLIALAGRHRGPAGRSTAPCRWRGPPTGWPQMAAGDTAGKIVLTVD